MSIIIKNNGPDIVSSNFWNTDAGSKHWAISVNSGTLRLLVPPAHEHWMEEMRNCDYAVVSTLACPRHDRLSMEILFEDHSASPFAIHLAAGAAIGFFPKADRTPIERSLTIWVDGPKKVASIRAFSRVVPSIPYLRPMKGVK